MKRQTLAGLLVATIAIGGGSRLFPLGHPLWDKSAGDVAYAVMVFWLVALAAPGARSVALGAWAITICVAIEAFQLTGIPARAPRVVQVALGTHFAWHDVACYVVGVALAMLLHRRCSLSVSR